MRRFALMVVGLVAATTLLLSLRSAPGATRTPDQVIDDQLAARRAALPSGSGAPPSVGPTTGPSPSPGLPSVGPSRAPGAPAGPTSGPAGPGPTTPVGATNPPVAPGGPTRQVTGASAFTEFGYVTVAITVASGRISEVTALEMPGDESRSVSISDRARPLLCQRALAAQGTAFDTVSGATWTSDAFKLSLQSAMRQAGLA